MYFTLFYVPIIYISTIFLTYINITFCRLTWLPVTEDTEEAPHVYSLLCELAASGHAALATPDAPQRVIATLAEAFLKDAVDPENPVFAQMVALVRHLQVIFYSIFFFTIYFQSNKLDSHIEKV